MKGTGSTGKDDLIALTLLPREDRNCGSWSTRGLRWKGKSCAGGPDDA
jgi:hypothetical protein